MIIHYNRKFLKRKMIVNILSVTFLILGSKVSCASKQINDIVDWIASTCRNNPIIAITLVLDPQILNNQSHSKLFHDITYIALQEDKFLSSIFLHQDQMSQKIKVQWINHLVIAFDSPQSQRFIEILDPSVLILNYILILGGTYPYLNLLNVRQNSRLFLHAKNEGIYEIYRMNPSLPITIQKLYDSNFHALQKEDLLLHDRRSDLKGALLRVGYANVPAFNHDQRSGVWYEILISLQKDLNFKIDFKKSPDNLFGSKTQDGKFNGMLGMIRRNEIDFSPEGFSITEVRREAAEFSFPIQESYAKLYVNAVNRIKLNWESFLKVYEWRFRVWILSYILIFIFILFVIFKAHQSQTRKPIQYVKHVLIIYFGILGLNYSTILKHTSFRILIITVMLFGALLAAAFNATLVSILSSTGKDVPIKTLEDLLKYKDFQLIVAKGTSIEEDLRYATKKSRPTYHKIYKERIEGFEEQVFVPSKILVQKLLSDKKYVMLNEEFYYITNFKNTSCFIKEDSYKYSFVRQAWAYNPNFEYKELFDHHILRMRESGAIQRFHKQMLTDFKLQRCTAFNDNPYSDIDFQNIILIFILIFVGIIISIFILICEVGVHRFSSQKTKNILEKELIG